MQGVSSDAGFSYVNLLEQFEGQNLVSLLQSAVDGYKFLSLIFVMGDNRDYSCSDGGLCSVNILLSKAFCWDYYGLSFETLVVMDSSISSYELMKSQCFT